jgi:hypothetical protein
MDMHSNSMTNTCESDVKTSHLLVLNQYSCSLMNHNKYWSDRVNDISSEFLPYQLVGRI